jgi:precorrin-2 dehydrogenase / sirohydrochlorin ferrochelatase
MSYYPILVDLKEKKVVVVGGGKVAHRKIEALLECQADIYIASRDWVPELEQLMEEGRIKFLGRRFSKVYLEGAFLVIASTDDSKLNRRVGSIAREMGILVNVVDQPADSNFIVPSVIKRGDLLIAISTSGKSPAMAKRVRERLCRQFGTEYEDFLLLMGRLRKDILSRGLSQKDNSRLFHELVDSTILQSIRRKDWKEIASSLERILEMRISPEEVMNYMKVE